MKVLLSWLRDFVDVPAAAEEIAATMSVRGFAVEGLERLGDGDTVIDFEVTGNRRVEPETVRSYLQFSTGEAYNAGKVDASIKALFATGLFADVAIDNKGPTVVVTVRENPVINQVAFEGNSEVVYFQGNYADYAEDLKRRKGQDADQPHRIRYKKIG